MKDDSSTSIRLAEPQDADVIHAMIMALARATDDQDMVVSTSNEFLNCGFGTRPLFDALIAEKDGDPVGLCVYFFSFSTWLGEPGVYVQDLYVKELERGTGLGLRLLQETARRARKRDATHLRLTVDRDNIAARKFYECVGMHHREDEFTFHIGKNGFLAMAGDHK